MGWRLGYHRMVKRLNRASVAGLGLMLVAGFLVSDAGAQIHGAPPSVTSMGFGGHPISGVSPSVTSLGPRGYTPGFNPAFPNSRPWFGAVPDRGVSGARPHHRPHHSGVGTVYAFPYFVYSDSSEYAESAPSEDQYNGGPTVFDRRGPGYASPPPEPEQPAQAVLPAAPPETLPEPSATLLVFKDGHDLEVGNYAIVGGTLYDLTEGHRRKVALADLDLAATIQQNDDRGIDFQLPANLQPN